MREWPFHTNISCHQLFLPPVKIHTNDVKLKDIVTIQPHLASYMFLYLLQVNASMLNSTLTSASVAQCIVHGCVPVFHTASRVRASLVS